MESGNMKIAIQYQKEIFYLPFMYIFKCLSSRSDAEITETLTRCRPNDPSGDRSRELFALHYMKSGNMKIAIQVIQMLIANKKTIRLCSFGNDTKQRGLSSQSKRSFYDHFSKCTSSH
ncbi:unnamed protein product, partial [Mesorhabditis belari]|uniref:Uncharacterized protein n=1 Tax=Mesorhabditis belari TaxID=2138241 RepID=A0AAF3EDA1_9BILA